MNMDKVELIDWDKYIIYENGDVFSKYHKKLLTNEPDFKGYIVNTYLMTDGTYKTCSRHRVIYYYFKKENIEGFEIDHIDTNRGNNSIDNLKLTDRNENCNNPLTRQHLSIVNKGKYINSPALSKPINQYDLNGNFIKTWPSTMEIQRQLGFSASSISKCCKGKLKTCGGYIWRYADEC